MNIENLKQAREAARFTQMQAAKALEISDGTYKNYEQGKREPNNTLLLKIADLYGVTTDYLLGREPAQPESNPLLAFKPVAEEWETLQKIIENLPERERMAVIAFLHMLSGENNFPVMEICQSTMVAVETAGDFRKRKEAEAEADAQRKETA